MHYPQCTRRSTQRVAHIISSFHALDRYYTVFDPAICARHSSKGKKKTTIDYNPVVSMARGKKTSSKQQTWNVIRSCWKNVRKRAAEPRIISVPLGLLFCFPLGESPLQPHIQCFDIVLTPRACFYSLPPCRETEDSWRWILPSIISCGGWKMNAARWISVLRMKQHVIIGKRIYLSTSGSSSSIPPKLSNYILFSYRVESSLFLGPQVVGIRKELPFLHTSPFILSHVL